MIDPWSIGIDEMMLRLGLAFLLGGLIGFEREQSNRAAGLRTNILVCVGSALIMLLSRYGFAEYVGHTQLDPARLAAQVVSGIGFLGAGVILFNGFSVTGLTTAATLWVVAGIGLAVGAGFYLPAAAVTVLVLFALLILNKVEEKWISPKTQSTLRIRMKDRPGGLGDITETLQKSRVDIKRIQVERLAAESDDPHPPVLISITLNQRPKRMAPVIEKLGGIAGVTDISAE
jgi:putative Mg2+ transporter-C (MgtC) family protein